MKNVELGPEERSVIAAAREAVAPTEIQRARVRRGLDAKLAAGVLAPMLATSTALATVLKVGASMVVVATLGTGIAWVSSPGLSHKSSAPSAAPGARAVTAPALQPAVLPAAEVSPVAEPAAAQPRPAPARARAPLRRHPAAPADLSGELSLLTQINAATQQGDVARAEALLQTYDQRYPVGQLAQERAAAGILVACATGRVSAARAEARHFADRWPRSPLMVRIQSACASEDKAH